jgi:predicted ArsR family transcriptional regulator
MSSAPTDPIVAAPAATTADPTRSETGLDRHRVLAVPSRAEILRVLRSSDAARTVQEVASAVGLHPNTAREHLVVLERAGLVERSVAHAATRGRPHALYRATALADEDAGAGRVHELLNRVLLDGYGTAIDAPEVIAERAAQALADPAPVPQGPRTADEAREIQLEALRRHFGRLGFGPEVVPDGTAVVLHRCPVLDLARERQDVVCSVHLGLARGVLAGYQGPVTATGLTPFAAPGRCVLHLDPDGVVGADEAPR